MISTTLRLLFFALLKIFFVKKIQIHVLWCCSPFFFAVTNLITNVLQPQHYNCFKCCEVFLVL